ncbi:hypothetical protein [Brunnivagina elsteri]|uniref:Antitoxin n=1 Tax=Brunnivagina elsteri CCALA 953 TaxID=987040 RepID=A0A2A2TJS2_9CYAN|nr:hypothetical protein [Calothrix elsteri]PAX55202.1 hypothetical protein CK510_11370 [Calothrix elsteri CCALA 953]
MTIQLDLKPETEARLIAQAAIRGVTVKQYLQLLIENDSQTEDWVNLLEEFYNNPALANVPPLSDEAISRESIYREGEDNQL